MQQILSNKLPQAAAEGLQQVGASLETAIKGDSPFGKYLTRHGDGTFEVVNNPELLKVEFKPLPDTMAGKMNENIPLSIGDPSQIAESKPIPALQLQEGYAYRVAGSTFATSQGSGTIIIKGYNGKDYDDKGQWFEIRNKEGKRLDPLSQKILSSDEKSVYVKGSNVTVLGPAKSTPAAPIVQK